MNCGKRLLGVLVPALLLTACGTTQRISVADTCAGKPPRSQCWMELESHPGCFVWNAFLQEGMTATWSGECAGNVADGEGELLFVWAGKVQAGKGSLVSGKPRGGWILNHADGRTENVTY